MANTLEAKGTIQEYVHELAEGIYEHPNSVLDWQNKGMVRGDSELQIPKFVVVLDTGGPEGYEETLEVRALYDGTEGAFGEAEYQQDSIVNLRFDSTDRRTGAIKFANKSG